ncbi:Helix-turn-helix domain-containing protein [Rhizobiales bacterium GAS191]|nr:Helix-turn-helix domain-containing protein [Rhizobiales bacterium GAS191]
MTDREKPLGDLGRKLRRMRLLRGMKQSHLAELMGVNQATVSRWERGTLSLSEAQRATAQLLLASPPDPAQDAALKRLVESSMRKVHLICDRTHRLLAASPARQTEWQADPAEFLGKSLLVYATAEILAAEATLGELGWHEGRLSCLAVDTGPNADPVLHILPGRMLWERIALADGTAGRLVTTIT